jgi:ABC-type amino acid transport substrate-binding protein
VREPGLLTVASAYPDPPFELVVDGVPDGFDVALIGAIAARVGLRLQPVRYEGDDFNGIFDGLQSGAYDAVISGTTITPEREARVAFSRPYLTFNQGIAVNRARSPHVRSADDLRGYTLGIQLGNTSDAVAKRLQADGTIAGIRYYPYHGIESALHDLEAGRIGAIVKLRPVLEALVRGRPALAVVSEVATHERLGIAFAKGNDDLRAAVDAALAAFASDGTLARLVARWFPLNRATAQ